MRYEDRLPISRYVLDSAKVGKVCQVLQQECILPVCHNSASMVVLWYGAKFSVKSRVNGCRMAMVSRRYLVGTLLRFSLSEEECNFEDEFIIFVGDGGNKCWLVSNSSFSHEVGRKLCDIETKTKRISRATDRKAIEMI